jgi:hypothetical protein
MATATSASVIGQSLPGLGYGQVRLTQDDQLPLFEDAVVE